jgi:hypothetical protein
MRTIPTILVAGLALLLAACSTPESRIAGRQAIFDSYPPDVKQKIRAGHIDIGFTPDMVRIALGEPDRVATRQTETGGIEVWGYRDPAPRFSFGIGLGTGGYHSGAAGGVAVSTGNNNYSSDEKMRVEFRAGLVSAIEVNQK